MRDYMGERHTSYQGGTGVDTQAHIRSGGLMVVTFGSNPDP